MTKERFHEALAFYEAYVKTDFNETKESRHLIEMTIKAREFYDAGRVEKAMRWLGFLQGAFYAWREFSIDELKAHVMPHGEEFKPVAQ